MQTRLVEPRVESLNSADSFLLVTEKYLHVWNGKDSNVMKKSKVLLTSFCKVSAIKDRAECSNER